MFRLGCGFFVDGQSLGACPRAVGQVQAPKAPRKGACAELDMPVGYKRRKWQAVLTVSASGPEFSPVLDEGGRFYKPRMAADLRYTTADVDFVEKRFQNGDYDSGEHEFHLRLRNPTQ